MTIGRRMAREWAIQILFQLDLNKTKIKDMDVLFGEFWNGSLRLRRDDGDAIENIPANIRDFTEDIVCGVIKNREAIDKTLGSCLENWDLDRIGGIERNVMRMGVYELCYSKEKIAPEIIINEAVDVCKFFSTRKSGGFINGILDSIFKKIQNERNTPQEWFPKK